MKEEVVELARELLLTNEYLFEIACEMAERQIIFIESKPTFIEEYEDE